MRIRTGRIPVPDKDARFTPAHFSHVFAAAPSECVLIGGQAVAWWAKRFGIAAGGTKDGQITSRDIDFWGTHEDLFKIAAHLKRTPILPNRHEMTVLVGAIALEAEGKRTVLEILHTVPGLDTANPLTAAIPQELNTSSGKKQLLVLSPVSLVIAKLHALRHFSQQDRNDLAHLKASLSASKAFITETLIQDARLAYGTAID